MLICSGPARSLPTPVQIQEIQTAIDKGTAIKARVDALGKQIDAETDPAKRKELLAVWSSAFAALCFWRDKAIVLTDTYFDIPGDSTGEPKYEYSLGCQGYTDQRGRVYIGDRAFRSPQRLATTKLHEFEHAYQVVDEHRIPVHRKLADMLEVEAYDWELKNVDKTGIPADEIALVHRARARYYKELTDSNKKLVDAKNYVADAVLIKDALDFQWVKAEFKGQGIASGKVMEVRFTPLVNRPIRLEIGLGTVLKPDHEGVQTMMVSRDIFVDVDKGIMTVMLPGYCLDPGKQPPPKEDKPGLTWSVEEPSDADRYPAAVEVIKAGNQLSDSSSFHTDLPPEKYRDTVIQRSLWCQADPTWNKERLQQDLEEQVKSSGGQQTPEQVQQLTNHLWDDVDLTLKAAKKR